MSMDTVQRKDSSPTISVKRNGGCMSKITDAIISFLENSFARFGFIVGTHPLKTILICIICSLLCLIGILRHREESRGEKLWVDQNSPYVRDQVWARENFVTNVRYINIMLKQDDVLTPDGLSQLLQIDQIVKDVHKNSGNDRLHWENIRFNQPPHTLLEFWSFNETKIKLLTKDDILEAFNKHDDKVYSPVQKRFENASAYLSEMKGNSTHDIVTAGVTKIMYFIKKNDTLDTSRGQWVWNTFQTLVEIREDELGAEWEREFAKLLKANLFPRSTIYYSTLESFLQAGLDAIGSDFGLLFTGYALIITYIAFQLGKFSRLQHKVWLALTGVICVALSVGVSYSLCAAAGVFYGPVHAVLPFLLLGIGVDDIFVIIQTWDNRAGSIDDEEPIAEKISRTMRHAGVAITVTSFTDVCALLIGATTILPALRSFCIYAGVGILMLYIFASSFFVAFLTIDAKRQRSHREACCAVKLPEDWKPLNCSKQFYLQRMLAVFSKIILSVYGKIIVLLITATVLGFGLYGLSQLNQDFDPDWFLPRDSDEIKYRNAYRKYFPSNGLSSAVYIGEIDYFAEQEKLSNLYITMQNDYSVLNYTVKSWYKEYIAWVKNDPIKSGDVTNDRITNETHFYTYFREFINENGKVYGSYFNYTDTNNIIKIKASRFLMSHKNIEGTNNQIRAMDHIRDGVGKITFNNGEHPFAFTFWYITWQTNRIIGQELVRNLSLAGVCVFVVTLVLIANIWTSLMVLTCVVFTLADICGYMYFWDLSIDTIISTVLVIALGFAVDYAAHIGHAFMASKQGNRNERSAAALVEIGPAVLNGGISTFLAFCLLAGSESYAFQTFFKVFFLVVSLGLWHGLVYLPVVLSLFGPKPYDNEFDNKNETEIEMSNGVNLSQNTQDIVENVEISPSDEWTVSKRKSTEESTESMIWQWIGFFVPKKPTHCKLIDLIHFYAD